MTGVVVGLAANARRAALRAAARTVPYAFGLERLGHIYGTDKIDEWHTHLGRTNCAVYEQYLRKWRRSSFSMLEIGVLNGASLRMWRCYFPRASVMGLDIDPRTAAMEREGFQILVGSQTETTLLDRALENDPRLVIDDGSHVNDLTIETFRYVFPRLTSGAIYVIEDTLNTYEPALMQWPGMAYNPPGINLENKREDIDALALELAHECDVGGPARTVGFVHTWPGLILVGRA